MKLEQLQFKDVSELSPEQGMIVSFARSGETRSRMRIEIDKERDLVSAIAKKQAGFCNITALSEAPLDWPASLVLEHKQHAPKHLHQVLNRCWDSSSEDSWKLPKGTDDWNVYSIKRILETNYWEKEVKPGDSDEGRTELLQLRVIATFFLPTS